MIIRAMILLILGVNMAMAQRNVHQRWEAQLERYVAPEGMINYSDWKRETHALKAYLKALEDHPPQPYWTTDVRKAYWINVYNAATIAMVLQHHPLQSIRDIDDPWKTPVFQWGNRSMSLKAIASLLLEMGDVRVLFALHRAAVSGPALSRKAYRSAQLEEQLETAAISFLTNPAQNQCHKDKSKLSRIFLWHFMDFGPPEQQLALLQKYGCKKVDQKTRFRYLPFDWRLNDWP